MQLTKIDTHNTKRKLKVAAYARVSTSSEEQLISLETQKEHYEQYIRKNPDWEFAGLYYDEGVSGTKLIRRDGLKRLLAGCDKGLLDYVLVKSISRFSRNTLDSLEIVRSLQKKGIYVSFEKEGIDTGRMEGELMLSILSGLAEDESVSISKNQTWGIQKRFMDGTYIIVCPPYGYKNQDEIMVIDPEKAEVVRWIFQEVLSGKSSCEIAKGLNLKGIPTQRGGKWTPCTILGMIKNEKYMGDAIFQKTFIDDQFKRHRNYGERNKYYIQNHHEPIISREDFEKANAVINENAREKGIGEDRSKYKNRYALSGKIICAECGGKWKRIMPGGSPAFVCGTHLKNSSACGIKAIKEDAIKAAFATMMNKLIFSQNAVLMPYSETLKRGSKKPERLKEIDALLNENLKQCQQRAEFFNRGFLTPAVYEEERHRLALEEHKLKDEKDELLKTTQKEDEKQKSLASLIRFCVPGNEQTAFDDKLFMEYVDHVVVYSRSEIGFTLKCGLTLKEGI